MVVLVVMVTFEMVVGEDVLKGEVTRTRDEGGGSAKEVMSWIFFSTSSSNLAMTCRKQSLCHWSISVSVTKNVREKSW